MSVLLADASDRILRMHRPQPADRIRPLVAVWIGIAMAWSLQAVVHESAEAADFKTLLADAGSLVFGDPAVDTQAPEPATPQPVTQQAALPPAPTAPIAADPPPAAAVHVAQRIDAARRPAGRGADASPLADAAKTGKDAEAIVQRLLPARSDAPSDWYASDNCLHAAGDPRALAPCVPPPPCDPSQPPCPHDLIGVRGVPSCGPIYGGPCEPRSARNHHGAFAWYHHLCDRMFDHFYRSK